MKCSQSSSRRRKAVTSVDCFNRFPKPPKNASIAKRSKGCSSVWLECLFSTLISGKAVTAFIHICDTFVMNETSLYSSEFRQRFGQFGPQRSIQMPRQSSPFCRLNFWRRSKSCQITCYGPTSSAGKVVIASKRSGCRFWPSSASLTKN